MNLKSLSDEQLLATTKRLATKEREILIEVLHHLLEINLRKAFSPKHTSLTKYIIAELGYSDDQAVRRTNAMHLLKEIPEIEPQIASANLNLTAVNLAQTHFRNERCTREQKLEVLQAIGGKSTRQVTRELISRSSNPEKLEHFDSVKPVSQTMNELKLYVKDEALDRISMLKGRLAHKYPHLSTSDLFEILLIRTLEETDPTREPTKARGSSAAPRNRTPNASTRREVFRDADGQCETCGSQHGLEVDHRVPFALGGETTKENLRLLCRNCNQRASVEIFGAKSYGRAPAADSNAEALV